MQLEVIDSQISRTATNSREEQAHTKHNQIPNEQPHDSVLPASIETQADRAFTESALHFRVIGQKVCKKSCLTHCNTSVLR